MKKFLKSAISRIKNQKIFQTLYYYGDKLIDKFDNDHIWIMSSGISFNILICAIPFFLMLLTVLGVYLDSNTVQDRLISYLNSMIPLPGQYKERFIFELIERTKELLVIVSVVLFLTTMAITSAVQVVEIYSQGIFGEYLTLTLFQKIVPVILGLLVSFCLFYVLYAYVPHWKFDRKIVLFSSIVAAVLFEALKFLFSVYILKIANYGRIYGTYATIVISIFYIYYLSVIFVVGAESGQIYFQRKKGAAVTV
ncbi:MAG: YihY/virulence factor BrkB family protein [Ignavibacteria bacterium]|nr:YihY/virulence factor BrkB family protein [Ignavibacteria bacterium]